ncbi:MAG: endonuclease NucS domain-containing protein [Allopontixanthobacter sediminis]
MNTPLPENETKPVLGLFSDEAELRDHLAERMERIEPGLTLLKTEYGLHNLDGSGGRIDILARDALDHVVCIEIKRSNNSARSTLNELSKYVTLLVERDRVPREIIRCVVIATHWSELLLPLSYFAHSTGIDVTALQAARDNGAVVLRPIPLKTLRFLPQLSPDMDLIWFETPEPRDRYLAFIKSRAPLLPFVRLALLLFEPRDLPREEPALHPMAICVWRVQDGLHDRIEAVTGKRIGHNFPYPAPGWEPEADAKEWIGDVPHDELQEFANGWTHGTPEKLHALLAGHALGRVERVGDWPKLEFINDDVRLLRAALAASPLGGSERPNRHSYRATVTPAVAISWNLATDAFLEFIGFEPVWQQAARAFLEMLSGSNVSVELHAFDKKHLAYAIHQVQSHHETMLGYFEIVARAGETALSGLHGYYTWDGKTCPTDAGATLDQIYGDVAWARLSMESAVDEARYERANELHGFLPVVDRLDETGMIHSGLPPFRHSLQDFLAANPGYCREVSDILQQIGPLPTDPSA